MRFWAASVVICCWLGADQSISQVSAQDTRPTKAEVESDAAKPAEKLDEILKAWEDRSSQIQSVRGTVERSIYSTVFESERLMSGHFLIQSTEKWRIDFDGVKPAETTKSQRVGRGGSRYRLEEGPSERFIRNGDEMLIVNVADRQYQRMQLPIDSVDDMVKKVRYANFWVSFISHCPFMPFLHRMTAEDVNQRFQVTLRTESMTECIVEFRPRLVRDRQRYIQVLVLIDKTSYMPKAIKTYDASGTVEIVDRFSEVTVNDDNSGFSDSNPLEPDFEVEGFKPVTRPSDKDPIHPDLKKQGFQLRGRD